MNQQLQKMPAPMAELRAQLQTMEGQFKAALPAHIPVERFVRVLLTALQNNPDLVEVERRSLWNAAMRAAQDGLLPDGREGAIVKYKDKRRGDIAQWMPMIAGLRKKVRNSGEIATWDVYVVHANDQFDFRLGDEPRIEHRPTLDDPGSVIAAYSIAVLKSGEKTREVMSVAAIEKVRERSRAKDGGPWFTDYEEMCRKTVARRHSKVLPMSTDLDDLLRRDDDLYDFEGAKQEAQADRPKSLSDRLDVLGSLRGRVPVAIEQENGTAPAAEDAANGNGRTNGAVEAEADASNGKPRGENGSNGDSKAKTIADAEANRGIPKNLDRRGETLLADIDRAAEACLTMTDLAETQEHFGPALGRASQTVKDRAGEVFARHVDRLSGSEQQ